MLTKTLLLTYILCRVWWVTDDIWSLNFAHCVSGSGKLLYYDHYDQIVKPNSGIYFAAFHSGISHSQLANLPDVCTNSPMYGQAFCKDHCDYLSHNACT